MHEWVCRSEGLWLLIGAVFLIPSFESLFLFVHNFWIISTVISLRGFFFFFKFINLMVGCWFCVGNTGQIGEGLIRGGIHASLCEVMLLCSMIGIKSGFSGLLGCK